MEKIVLCISTTGRQCISGWFCPTSREIKLDGIAFPLPTSSLQKFFYPLTTSPSFVFPTSRIPFTFCQMTLSLPHPPRYSSNRLRSASITLLLLHPQV